MFSQIHTAFSMASRYMVRSEGKENYLRKDFTAPGGKSQVP